MSDSETRKNKRLWDFPYVAFKSVNKTRTAIPTKNILDKVAIMSTIFEKLKSMHANSNNNDPCTGSQFEFLLSFMHFEKFLFVSPSNLL